MVYEVKYSILMEGKVVEKKTQVFSFREACDVIQKAFVHLVLDDISQAHASIVRIN